MYLDPYLLLIMKLVSLNLLNLFIYSKHTNRIITHSSQNVCFKDRLHKASGDAEEVTSH